MGTELLIQKLQRDLNCLTDPDRSSRRRALERLPKRLLNGDPGERAPSPAVIQEVWDQVILRLVVRVLGDSVEKCRELAIQLIKSVIKVAPLVNQTVLLILPVMAERMGQMPVLEESEEIRLQLVQLLATSLLPQCPVDICLIVSDPLLKVLISAVADPFHEIKKGACHIIVSVGERAPKTLEERTEPLLKALLPNINHSHSRVRMATLQAIDEVVRIGLPPGTVSTFLPGAVRPLAFDRSVAVREVFFSVVARWLGYEDEQLKKKQNSINQNGDSKVNLPYLLPLLLLGVTDESKDLATASLSLVEEVGRVYEEQLLVSSSSSDQMMIEAVEEMSLKGSKCDKDTIMVESVEKNDLNDQGRDIYSDFLLPPPYKGRPSVGCLKMVQAYLGELIKPTAKELHEWTSLARLGAARLIHTLLVLAEECTTEYLDLLLPAFFSAVGDDDVAVAQQIVSAVQVLGFHVHAENWVPLVLDLGTNTRNSEAQRANGLVVMAGLIYGTPKHRISGKLVMQLSAGLAQADVRCSDHPAVKSQLLAVVTNLLHVAGSLCASSALNIFLILLQLQSAEDLQLQHGANHQIDTFTKLLELASVQDLYLKHINGLIPLVTVGHEEWLGASPGRSLFQTFVKNSGITVGPYLSTLINMFETCLHQDRDPALRISFLQLLDDLFENQELGPWWVPLAEHIIGEILIPCGVWRIGKVGAAIRHRAMVALGTFLRRDLCTQDQLLKLLPLQKGILGVIISCLDEDYYVDTRRATCHVMQHLIRIAGPAMGDAERNTVSTEIQKRLDDSNDNVRLGILPAIGTFFHTMPTSFGDEAVRVLLTNLLVHMDDPNQKIQEAVCLVAEACGTQRPQIVIEVAKKVCNGHRSTTYCNRLIAFAATLESS